MGNRKDWGTDLNCGGSFTRGNTDVNYMTSGFGVFKSFHPSTAYLSGSMIYNTYNHVRIVNQGTLTARYDYPLRGPWKLFVFNTNAYNDFIKLNYRETAGVGPWYDWTWGPIRHGTSLAITQEYERYFGGVYKRAARFSFRNISSIAMSPVASLGADFYYVPRVDELGDYHLFAQIDFETIFWKEYLGLKVSWIDEYESRHQPGIKPSDTLWLTTLNLHLGR